MRQTFCLTCSRWIPFTPTGPDDHGAGLRALRAHDCPGDIDSQFDAIVAQFHIT